MLSSVEPIVQIMNHNLSENDRLFDSFLLEYGDRLNKICPVLQFLNTYPEVITALDIERIVRPEELLEHQKEWVWLVSKFDGLEKEHFRPYWLPIEKESYSCYIDLSDDAFPIFKSDYYGIEPYCYFITEVFKSAADLLQAIDNKIDFTNYHEYINDRVWQNFGKLISVTEKLRFEGKLPIDKPKFHQIFDDDTALPAECLFDGVYYTVICREINAQICGLLPFTLGISITESTFDKRELDFIEDLDLSLITDIRTLTYAIGLYGSSKTQYYKCSISENLDEYISYSYNKFVLQTADSGLRDYFLAAYNEMRDNPKPLTI